jgi:IclR family acetate operon transcriptional repressor
MVDHHEPVGVREIGRDLDLAASSAHRILTMLVDEGLIRQEADGDYSLGIEFFRLVWRGAGLFPLSDVARPVLRELAEKSSETALLGAYEPSRREVIFVLTSESPHALRYVVPLNQWMPLHAGASGLAILAFLPEDEREEVLRGPLKRVTPQTLVNAKELRRELDRIRERGFARTSGQRTQGAVGIAAPIFGPAGRVVGDLAITLPEQRLDGRGDQLARMVQGAARLVSRRLSASAG